LHEKPDAGPMAALPGDPAVGVRNAAALSLRKIGYEN
jgi:hypothetical protein